VMLSCHHKHHHTCATRVRRHDSLKGNGIRKGLDTSSNERPARPRDIPYAITFWGVGYGGLCWDVATGVVTGSMARQVWRRDKEVLTNGGWQKRGCDTQYAHTCVYVCVCVCVCRGCYTQCAAW
jgi:hypothetical protein